MLGKASAGPEETIRLSTNVSAGYASITNWHSGYPDIQDNRSCCLLNNKVGSCAELLHACSLSDGYQEHLAVTIRGISDSTSTMTRRGAIRQQGEFWRFLTCVRNDNQKEVIKNNLSRALIKALFLCRPSGKDLAFYDEESR